MLILKFHLRDRVVTDLFSEEFRTALLMPTPIRSSLPYSGSMDGCHKEEHWFTRSTTPPPLGSSFWLYTRSSWTIC